MVYGVFSSCFSDWCIYGYFADKTEAEKYCVKKNLQKRENEDAEDYYSQDDYYVKDIPDLSEENFDTSDVKLRYYHEVFFDFGKGMRNEPYRYTSYTGKPNPPQARYNVFNDNDGWIVFALDCENRKKAEKIAQDKYAMFMNLYHDSGSFEMAAHAMGINKIW